MSDSDDELDNAIENGHLPVESDTEHELDQFDIDLPTSHRYLGKLTNVSNYIYYEHGEIATLPALQTNTLVFPGFTLPLVLTDQLEIGMLQRQTHAKRAFVLLAPNADRTGTFRFGYVMEIYEMYTRREALHLKARCRQRCRLVAAPRPLLGELHQATVEVHREPEPRSPLHDTQLAALRRRRRLGAAEWAGFGAVRRWRRFHLAQFPLAGWVYEKHEACFLVAQLRRGLADHQLGQFVPADAVRLSYWFVQNFQLRHGERLRIMRMETAVERLRLEVRLLALERVICCERCGVEVAQPRNVFAMSKDGVQGNYCNPGGNVFETVTVTKASNVKLIGVPSAQFSWFPGYSWIILQCSYCNSHLGWRFSSGNLKPSVFYGLAKSGMSIKIIE